MMQSWEFVLEPCMGQAARRAGRGTIILNKSRAVAGKPREAV